MLPAVPFCGLTVTRLIIGANPFAGFSHQTPERNQQMLDYHTPQRIIETWHRAQAAGINTMITNNENPNVMQAVREYLGGGGTLQWIAQVAEKRKFPEMIQSIDDAVKAGCKALYIHGGEVDQRFASKDEKAIAGWCEYARRQGVKVGVAAHAPAAHRWVDRLDVVDFHVVCFFNCGSLHDHKGDRFQLRDMAAAVDCIRSIRKPCIGYKIMGAGRIDPRMAFEYAFENIKPGDVVNVGMHRGDKDQIVEENAALVREILAMG